jgi:preprotein translocase subunit SecE
VAKTKSRPEPARKSSKSNIGVIRYFQDTREELRKVTWPDREEITRLTVIVLTTTIAFAAFLGILDFIFQRLAGLVVGG